MLDDLGLYVKIMRFGINYSNIDKYLSIIEEEKKEIRYIKEEIESLYAMQLNDDSPHNASLASCLKDIKILEENAKDRIELLEMIHSDSKRVFANIEEIIERSTHG